VAERDVGDEPGSTRPPSLRQATVRGARLALFGYVLSRGILFFLYVVLARLVTPADFGRYAAASVIVGIGTLFTESGMMSALIQRPDRIEEAASTAFYSLLIGGVLLSAAALALAPVLGAFFSTEHVTALAAVLSAGMLLRALAVVPDALLQRRFSYARRVAVDPLGAVAFASASIITCANGAGAWGLVAGSYASLLVQVSSAWWFARFRPRRRLASVQMWRELASFARHVLGAEILSRVADQLDTLMLGRFGSAAALGQYKNGLRLAQQPSDAFVGVGAYVLLPALARMADNREQLAAVARRLFRLTTTVALPVSLALLPLGEPAAVLLLGPRWALAGHTIAALCGVVIAGAMISLLSEVFKALGRPRILVRMNIVGIIAMAALVTVTAITLGPVGVAASVSITQLLTAAYALWRAGPLVQIGRRELGAAAAGPALAAAVMVAIMFAFAGFVDPLAHRLVVRWALTVTQALLGAITYASVLLLVDRSRRRSTLDFVAARRTRDGPLAKAG
jgi:O-antigen/teichoic acid export membrane protein